MIISRKMCETDISAVARLEIESFSDPWSEKSIIESLKQTFSECLVAEEGKKVVGYLIFYKNLDEGELLRIAVNKKYQRLGVGSLLMEELKQYCIKFSVKRMMLDVRKSNTKAKMFYKKQGFVADGERKHFYSNPDETAILMSRRL